MADNLEHWQVDLTGGRVQLDNANFDILLEEMQDKPRESDHCSAIDIHGSSVLIFYAQLEAITHITPTSVAHWRSWTREMRKAVDAIDPEGAEDDSQAWRD